MSKTCITCGMPMTKPHDYPGGDEKKDYCIYCARPDGSMQSHSEKLQGMTQFIMRTQGFDELPAREIAERAIAKLPAWSGVRDQH